MTNKTSKTMDDQQKQTNQMAIYAVYGATGVQLAVSVIAGWALGSYLDKKFGTLPWLTTIGIILGFIGGLINLVRILGWFSKKNDAGEKSK